MAEISAWLGGFSAVAYDSALAVMLLLVCLPMALWAVRKLTVELSGAIVYRVKRGNVLAALLSVGFCALLTLPLYGYVLTIDSVLAAWLPGVLPRAPVLLLGEKAFVLAHRLFSISRASDLSPVIWCGLTVSSQLLISGLWRLVDLPRHRAETLNSERLLRVVAGKPDEAAKPSQRPRRRP